MSAVEMDRKGGGNQSNIQAKSSSAIWQLVKCITHTESRDRRIWYAGGGEANGFHRFSHKISEDSRTSSQSSRPAREKKQRVLLLSGKTTPQLSLSLSFIQLLSALVCLSRNEPHIPIYTILNVSLSFQPHVDISSYYIYRETNLKPPPPQKKSFNRSTPPTWLSRFSMESKLRSCCCFIWLSNFSLHSGLTSCPIDIPSTGLPSPMTSLTGIISRPSMYSILSKKNEARKESK